MTTLNKGVIAAGMDRMLSGTGPYTVFAPSDMAFSKLEPGAIEDLLRSENKVKLTDLLNLHVIEGKFNIKDLKDGQQLKTLNGKELLVKVTDDKVTVDGATIQSRDVKSSNGVIHTLDMLLKN